MIKLNTEQELIKFLKILSEESVSLSKKKLSEAEDPYFEKYRQMRKSEKETMFEQEAEAQPPEQEDAEDSDAAPEEESKPAAKTPDEQEADSPGEFIASKDRLEEFVNDIRSAPSITDSAVSEQINAYYDRLSQEEKNVLVFFLRELSRVMTGKASGQSARDPSDPPLNIDFVPKGEEEKDDSQEAEKGAEAPAQAAEPDKGDDIDSLLAADEEEEDTTPPIAVNEAQNTEYIRKKIRQLLR